MALRVDDAMIEIIARLNDITEHLRRHNYMDSANKIAKSAHDIVDGFTDAVVKFNNEQMVMVNLANNAAPGAVKSKEQNAQGLTIHVGQASQAKVSHMPPAPVEQLPSWANVAAAEMNWNKREESLAVNKRSRATSVPPTNAVMPSGHSPVLNVEDEEKAATLTVTGAFGINSLNNITSRIQEGPLFSVDINYNQNYAEIAFQKASHAASFLEQDDARTAMTGHGQFGPGYRVVRAVEFEWNDDMRKMEEKPRERRRLTFARAGLISGAVTLRRLQNDMARIVGVNSIEFVWAFNAGNATAVFKGVAVARTVRNHFLEKANDPASPYHDVQVTFSTDPCEKPLHLETQFGPAYRRRGQNVKPGKRGRYGQATWGKGVCWNGWSRLIREIAGKSVLDEGLFDYGRARFIMDDFADQG